jgi:hypothetical protein
MPYVGRPVTLVYSGFADSGVVQRVEDGGRHLTVLTDDDHLVTFALNRATGRFTSVGPEPSARLLFPDENP